MTSSAVVFPQPFGGDVNASRGEIIVQSGRKVWRPTARRHHGVLGHDDVRADCLGNLVEQLGAVNRLRPRLGLRKLDGMALLAVVASSPSSARLAFTRASSNGGQLSGVGDDAILQCG